MLREFVQCANVDERLALVSSECASAWSADELDAAMNIVGTSTDKDTNEAKIQAIMEALKRNSKEALSDEYVSRARKLTDDIPGVENGMDHSDYEQNMNMLYVKMAAMHQISARM